MVTLIHALAFVTACGGLLGTGCRIARMATPALDTRLVIAGTVAGFLAVVESLLLGLVSVGTSTWALTIAALLTWAAACALTAPHDPTLGRQLAGLLAQQGRWSKLALGSLFGLGVTSFGYLNARPLLSVDALTYHLAEPAIWLTGGQPGSLRVTISGLPAEAYPKSGEVLASWTVSLDRTLSVTPFLMAAVFLLTAVAAWSVCHRLGAPPLWSGVIALVLLLSPIPVSQLAGPNTDLITLCWLACTAALCLAAARESRVLPVALLAAALAVSTKTTAVPVVAVLVLATAWVTRGRWKSERGVLALAAVVALPLALLWYVRDFVHYGAPLYPFSSFPAGRPVPAVIARLGASFLSDPFGALRVGTGLGYARVLGGLLVLGVGVLVVVVVEVVSGRKRPAHRALLLLVGGAAAETLLWTAAPFTGWSGVAGSETLVVGGLRYLLPGAALWAATLAAATGGRRAVALTAKALAVLGLCGDAWALHRIGPPYRPPLWLIAVGLAVGVAVAAVLFASSGLRMRMARPHQAVATLLVGVLSVSGVVLASHGYVGRALVAQREAQMSDKGVLAFLNSEPAWIAGHAPIAVGPTVNALYAGPRLNHALSVVPPGMSCAGLQAAGQRDWIVLTDLSAAASRYYGLQYRKRQCLAGTKPVYRNGRTSVYAPAGETR